MWEIFKKLDWLYKSLIIVSFVQVLLIFVNLYLIVSKLISTL